ncbi:DUF2484 family protein [Vannielia litorea]|uniref:UDP-N-acetylmuramate--alanine ligase n=1 Tax=Vannielia litorea TaxID=1217970 RepID=A0A1N6ESH2_9RHOB|nr:DUF2484 family protein [Vannielia litorea]SIN85947.1 Protein of unknown function [Vannielia litorea]
MSPLLIAALLWVFAATATAFLPMRWQIVPGLALIAGAVVLIGLILADYGPVPGVLALAVFVSFFRRPLGHLLRKLTGRAGA